MDGVSLAMVWWLVVGALVAAELLTGSFYLLMLAAGFAAAAVSAHLGASLGVNILVASLVGGGATYLWHVHRQRRPHAPPTDQDRNLHFDIDERVNVASWSADGTASVTHRGSLWRARLAEGHAPVSGLHVVSAVNGNTLLLKPADSR